MARRTTVVLLDDLDGSPAEETVQFGLDGIDYAIDVSADHAAGLRDALAGFLAHARRRPRVTGRGGGGSGRTASRSGTPTARAAAAATVDREQARAMRRWAREHGYPASDRGRLPRPVIEAYHRGDPTALPTPHPHSAGPTGDAGPGGPDGAAGATGNAGATGDAGRAATAAAEPVEPAGGAAQTPGPDGLIASEREQIRAWATEQGIEVKSRGRLRAELIANYRATQARQPA